MSVTTYTLDKKYNFSKLKNVLYLVSEDHIKDIHVDNGVAYISGLTGTQIRINGFNIQYSEETSLDERYKFNKKLTISVKGYVSHSNFENRYYAIIEDNDGIYYMVNVDFPSTITHTFNLSQNTNQTDFTFSSLSNFPTIKLDASSSDFETEELVCEGYNVYGIETLRLIDKNYARINTISKKVVTTDNWKAIEFLGKSCTFQETYDGENVTDTITFNIPLNHKIGWSWNLLEFLDNLYASTIIPKGGGNKYYSGFNFGLQPSYDIQSSSNNGESDIITVTLTEMSNYGSTASSLLTDEDDDTKSWRYVKTVGDIICFECVGQGTARYLVQQEVDVFGNPTGNYKVKDGYQSLFPTLHIVGTFNNDERFSEVSCEGDICKITTTIPDVIVFSSTTCNTYTLSASCDWNITDLAEYLTASPSSGNANQQYNVTICNTESQIDGQTSTFSIKSGNNVRIINTALIADSFINPVVTSITCAGQDVQFAFDTSCPVTVTSIDSRLTYNIGNSTLTITVPANLLTTSEKIWSIDVQDCSHQSMTLKILQDKVYEKWVDSGFYICVNGSSYKEEIRYTGETPYNISHITTEHRVGELIKENDSRCNKRMTKYEFEGNYYCVNGNKIKVMEQFESYDNGLTWRKTGVTMLGETVETASTWCDNIAEYEWRLTDRWQCGDEPSLTYTFEYCDGKKFLMQDVENSGGTFEYCVVSNNMESDVEYMITSICDWVSIETGSSSFTVSVSANSDPSSDRECVVFFNQKTSGKQLALNILQEAGLPYCDRLLDSCCGVGVIEGHPDCDIELGKQGGYDNDGILGGARIRMTSTLPSWLSVINHQDDPTPQNYVSYSALTDNESIYNRFFTVEWEKVSGGTSAQCETAQTIVKQLGGAVPRPYRFYWQNGLTYFRVVVTAESGEIETNLVSTIDDVETSFTASIEDSWINPTYTATNNTFKVAFDANTGDTSRTSLITLTQNCGDLNCATIILEIDQTAQGASGETYIRWSDSLHPRTYSATTTWNGHITFGSGCPSFFSLLNGIETNAVMSTDTNWIITYNQLYYNYNELKPNRNETIYLNPNTTESPRTGLLTLTQKGGTDYIQLYITQDAYIADCSITTFTMPDTICKGEPLTYEYTVQDSRCDRTFYFNLFDSEGKTYTSTSTPFNGRGTGTFDTSKMPSGTAVMSVVIGSYTTLKEVDIKDCGSEFYIVGDSAHTISWNGNLSPVYFISQVNGANTNAVMSSNVSWIRTSGSYYMNNNELQPATNNTVYIDNNTSNKQRIGTLTLTQKGTDNTIKISVTQEPYVAECKITSFSIASGDTCQGSPLNFSFTLSSTACTSEQNFNIYDAEGTLFNVKVTPSNGSGSSSFDTSYMAVGEAVVVVVVNGATTTYRRNITNCGTQDTLFESLRKSFNTVLGNSGSYQITSGGTPQTYNYLKTLHDEAVSEYNDSYSSLFNKTTYPEIYDYRDGSILDHNRGLSAYTSWLMAMQLSELYANSGTSDNMQTKLFKHAYDIGGGRQAPLYGYADIRSDVTACRLAASAIYARNWSKYGFSGIDVFKNEVHVPRYSAATWDELGQDTYASCANPTWDSQNRIGYCLNLYSIFPTAPGPFATNYLSGCFFCDTPTGNRSYPSEQPSSLFNQTTKNYLVDEKIDNFVCNSYNLNRSGDVNFSRAVQAVADQADDALFAYSNKTYYKCGTGEARNTFSAATPTDFVGYFIGPFGCDTTGKDLSSELATTAAITKNHTYLRLFTEAVQYMGGNARKTLLNPNYGRRRPGQGEGDAVIPTTCHTFSCATLHSTARVYDGGQSRGGETTCGNITYRSWSPYKTTKFTGSEKNHLSDSSIDRLVGTGTHYDNNHDPKRYFIDKDGDGIYDNGEIVPNEIYSSVNSNYETGLHANTYPSGHSSEYWTLALYLIMMMPTKWLEIFRSAYAYTVSRTISRAHWNSDILYGKLVGTMIVPVINAMGNGGVDHTQDSYIDDTGTTFSDRYNSAKAIIDEAGGCDYLWCSFVIHNNRSTNITIKNKLTIVLQNGVGGYGWDGCYNRYTLFNSDKTYTLQPGRTVGFMNIKIVDSNKWNPDVPRTFLNVANCKSFKNSYPNNANVMVYDTNGNSETYVPNNISPTTQLLNGETYHIYIN